jgi:hypothetical protein
MDQAQAALANVQHGTSQDLGGDQATIVLRIFDKTGSLIPYVDEVRAAERANIRAWKDSDAADDFLVSTWLFNAREGFTVLDGFVKLDDVTPLDESNYGLSNMRRTDMTNLYDTVYLALTDPHAGVLAYAKTLRDVGIRVKVIVGVFTDGADNQSVTSPARIKDVTVNTEGQYFCLLSFGTGFAKNAATEMGFANLLEANASDGEYRKMVDVFSKSGIRVSQTIVKPNGFFA